LSHWMYILYFSGNNILYFHLFYFIKKFFYIDSVVIFDSIFFFIRLYFWEANKCEYNTRNKQRDRLWPEHGPDFWKREIDKYDVFDHFAIIRAASRNFECCIARAIFREWDLGNRIVTWTRNDCYVSRVRTCRCVLAHLSRGSNRVSVDLCCIWNISENVHRVTK